MQWSMKESRLAELMRHRNGYLVLSVGLLLLSLSQVIFIACLIGSKQVVVTPPVVERRFWVSTSSVSTAYLTQMTQFFVGLRFNVTPETVDFQHQTLLRFTQPRYYGALKALFFKEAKRIKQLQLSTVFYPVKMIAHAKALSVDITGDRVTFMGSENQHSARVTFHVNYRFFQGRLLVSDFRKELNHG